MPRVPGIKVLKEMNEDEKLRDIPVLMITVETNEEQVLEAAEYEIKNYIIKPFVVNTLQEKMMNIINPPEYLKWIKEGEKLIDKGEYNKAIAILKDILETKPESACIRTLMGNAYVKMKENEKALELYKEAIKKNPQYLKAYDTLAVFQLKAGQKQEALRSLEEAAKISPLNANRQIMIGDLALESSGDMEKAHWAFKVAMRLDPEMANDVAEIYMKNGNDEEAEMLFRTVLKHKVKIHVYNRLGIALRHQNKWHEAITEYQKALKIEPENDIIFYNMGLAYLDGHEEVEAIKLFKKALKINPDFADPKKMLQKLQNAE